MSGFNSIGWIDDFHMMLKTSEAKIEGKKVSLDEGFSALAKELERVGQEKTSVWWVGNGGSSALCSHFSQDLLNKLGLKSQPLSDASLLTCMANDYGYPSVYARPLSVLMGKGDLLIAISSSGKSQNILSCTAEARSKGARVASLSGFEPGNPLWQESSAVSFYVPSQLYGQVEIGHAVLLHAVIETAWLNRKN